MDKKDLSQEELNAAFCEIWQAIWVGEAMREVLTKERELSELTDDTHMVHIREALAHHFDKEGDKAMEALNRLESYLGIHPSFDDYREHLRRHEEDAEERRVRELVGS